ncbi:MAG: terminase [Sphingomonadaceae bacterium]|nr:terminase [Sphingomonadaceae bacterium]
MRAVSLARAHQERVLAGLAAGQPAGVAGPRPTLGPAATAYDRMLMQLAEDRRRLHDIQSVERKIALKRELVPHYRDWVMGAVAAGRERGAAVQDEVVATIMVWLIDIGDFANALTVAEHVLRFRLALPERYKRDPATLVTEEIAEAALARLARGEAFALPILMELDALVDAADMPDEVRAKFNKAIGLELARAADADAALDGDAADSRIAGFAASARAEALARFRRALELNPGVGVKKNIETLDRAVRKDAAEVQETGGDPA